MSNLEAYLVAALLKNSTRYLNRLKASSSISGSLLRNSGLCMAWISNNFFSILQRFLEGFFALFVNELPGPTF